MEPQLRALEAQARSARSSGGGLWDSDLVAGVAFHPRKCSASSRPPDGAGGWVDSDYAAEDGTRVAYRLYLPGPMTKPDNSLCVLVYFHANAELCTDLEDEVGAFFDCGYNAIVCPEYRGYAWSGGKPQLRSLCPDADAFMEALPAILEGAGLEPRSARIVVHGRSLGSACAVHVASTGREAVSGLVVESGVMQLLELPMVQQLGMMMPAMLQMLYSERCPLNTLAEMRRVEVPTLVIHGERDDISPLSQGSLALQACAGTSKKMARFKNCRHNDIRAVARKEYYSEIRAFCLVARGEAPEAPLEDRASDSGFLAAVAGALRCFPGMRRCLAREDTGTGVS